MTSGGPVNSSDSDSDKWMPTQITSISGDDVDPSAHTDGDSVIVWSGNKVTITFPTKYPSNDHAGYPYYESAVQN